MKILKKFDISENFITDVYNDDGVLSNNFKSPYIQMIPSLIIDNLYLGPVNFTKSKECLRKFNISAVLSIGPKLSYISKKIVYKHFQCQDNELQVLVFRFGLKIQTPLWHYPFCHNC